MPHLTLQTCCTTSDFDCVRWGLSVMSDCPDSMSVFSCCRMVVFATCCVTWLTHRTVFVLSEQFCLRKGRNACSSFSIKWKLSREEQVEPAPLFLLGLHSWCLCSRSSCLAARKQLLSSRQRWEGTACRQSVEGQSLFPDLLTPTPSPRSVQGHLYNISTNSYKTMWFQVFRGQSSCCFKSVSFRAALILVHHSHFCSPLPLRLCNIPHFEVMSCRQVSSDWFTWPC